MTLNIDKIRGRRNELHMTQQQLADKVGMNRDQYAKREKGKVSIGADELGAIATALGVSDIRFFFEETFPNENKSTKG